MQFKKTIQKNKFKFLFLLFLFMVLAFGCTVNSTTGIIIIQNTSNTTISNVQIGNTILAISLAPGAKYDYYFYAPLSGSITATGSVMGYADWDFDSSDNFIYTGDEILYDGTFTLKTNYWFRLYAEEQDGKTYMNIAISEQGGDWIDAYNSDEPFPYKDFYEE